MEMSHEAFMKTVLGNGSATLLMTSALYAAPTDDLGI